MLFPEKKTRILLIIEEIKQMKGLCCWTRQLRQKIVVQFLREEPLVGLKEWLKSTEIYI